MVNIDIKGKENS